MTRNFQRLTRAVTHEIPKLSDLLAEDYVNDALLEIYSRHHWAFLRAEGIIHIPAQLTSTGTITQYSATITVTGASKSVLDALGSDVPITSRQVRIGSGMPYIVTAYDGSSDPSTITLDRPVVETGGSQSITIIRCYVAPPSTDFLRFINVKNILPGATSGAGYTLDLYAPPELVDRGDPQRISTGGQPLAIFACKGDSNADPLFEVWPWATTDTILYCKYQRRGTELSAATDTPPRIIPAELLTTYALFKACKWANQNMGRYAELKGVNWLQLSRDHLAAFEKRLEEVWMDAKNQSPQEFEIPSARVGVGVGVGANYRASHAYPAGGDMGGNGQV